MGSVRVDDVGLRTKVPRVAREAAKSGLRRFGKATGDRRPLPDFLIIGAQKSGTSALYRYLTEHASVRRAIVKEVHFFDLAFHRGERWYRGHFSMRSGRTDPAAAIKSGEATPYYLFHPLVPGRVASMLPSARFIVLLREPVIRLVSHYHHEVALGFERRSMEHALDAEREMVAIETARLLADPCAVSFTHQHHSYFSRGLYARQLETWFSKVPRERFLVVRSEDLWADTAEVFARVERFLGLTPSGRSTFAPVNAARCPTRADPAVVARLHRAYEPEGERLRILLGDDFGWPGERGWVPALTGDRSRR